MTHGIQRALIILYEGNVLFNDALNTFLITVTCCRTLVRTIQTAREETRCCHMATLSNLQQGFFYMHHPTDRIIHTTAFVTPVVEHWLEGEIAQWVKILNA